MGKGRFDQLLKDLDSAWAKTTELFAANQQLVQKQAQRVDRILQFCGQVFYFHDRTAMRRSSAEHMMSWLVTSPASRTLVTLCTHTETGGLESFFIRCHVGQGLAKERLYELSAELVASKTEQDRDTLGAYIMSCVQQPPEQNELLDRPATAASSGKPTAC